MLANPFEAGPIFGIPHFHHIVAVGEQIMIQVVKEFQGFYGVAVIYAPFPLDLGEGKLTFRQVELEGPDFNRGVIPTRGKDLVIG